MSQIIFSEISKRLFACAGILLLSACATATYSPAKNEVMAHVTNIGWGAPSFCKDGTVYSMIPGKGKNDYLVPAGAPISLRSQLREQGGAYSVSCIAKLAFTPEANQAYVFNAGLFENRCFVELARRDNSTETGLIPEPSIRRSDAC